MTLVTPRRLPLRHTPWCLVLILLSCSCDSSDEEHGLRKLWEYGHAHAGAPEVPPEVIGDRWVIGVAGLDILCFDLKTGAVRWQQRATDDFTLKHESMAMGNTHVLTAHLRDYRAFRLSDGAKVLQRPFDDETGYPWVLSKFASTGDLLLTDRRGYILAWNDADLSLRWRSVPLPGDELPATIQVADGRIFVGAFRAGSSTEEPRGRITALDLSTGEVIWTFEHVGGAFALTPLVVERGVVYAASSGSSDFALDAATGRVLWQQPEGGGALTGFTYDDGKLFGNAGGRGGRYTYARDAQTGRLLWSVETSSGGPEEIVAQDGYVYSLDVGALYVIEAATGRVVHREYPPDEYWWNLSKGGGKIIAQATNYIVAFDPYKP